MNLIQRAIPLVLLATVATTTLFVVTRNLPLVAGSFRQFWGPIAVGMIFLFHPSVFRQKPIRFLFLYGVLSLGVMQYAVWQHMSDWNRLKLQLEFYDLFIISVIFFYYYSRQDYKGLAKLAKWAFVFIVITIIMTNIALFFDPSIVRRTANISLFNPSDEKLYNLTGVAGYGFMQALVCLIPILVYHIKFKKKMVFSRNILIAILVLLMITMVRAQVFANLLAAIAITTLSFAGSKDFRRSFVLVSMAVILLLLIPPKFYADMFVKASTYFNPDSNIHYKLNDFAFFIQYPEFDSTTGAGNRAGRYLLLFQAFSAAPLLGDSSYKSPFGYNVMVGGHLYWMNKLTIWGILGFVFFIFVLNKLYKTIRSLFSEQFRFYYLLSIAAFILLGLLKNLASMHPFLMLILVIPGVYFFPLLDKKQKNKIRVTI